MSSTVGAAMIGLGKWSRHLADAVQRSQAIELVACYTRTEEKRQVFADTYSCFAAPTLEEALTAPRVEAAIIATPAHIHADLTMACAQRGLSVFVEKPMALSVHDAIEMEQACDQNGVTLMVGHEMRRLGSTRAMKRLVEAGTLGRIITATANMTLAGTFHPDNWRCHRDTNRGGALMQLGIHQIENLNYLLGDPASVQGMLANVVAPGEVDDVGIAAITYKNGTQAVVSSNYVSPSAYNLHLYGDRANVYCNADMRVWPQALEVDPNTSLVLQNGSARESVNKEPRDVLLEQMEEFARSIRGEREVETGAREGLMAVAVVEAALESFAAGQAVDPGTYLDREINLKE